MNIDVNNAHVQEDASAQQQAQPANSAVMLAPGGRQRHDTHVRASSSVDGGTVSIKGWHRWRQETVCNTLIDDVATCAYYTRKTSCPEYQH